ncbi:DUF192 domain-containing protein [Siansivirga zeaxanthinifaciens]|uniref:DUF192 domain-containing protein n=1 Tax=Siansivirga zeaxanthinifaciens CC-SAMT-1 TaxID=1454006 RepID=A0A0C5W963_9FLAO|nr:DUF192 domain-containing protein [Siansivirga zeaxanthinifaciens]AJR03683.1 hypothetical protein AW14_08645 [Siansivirga zeaxanthinifaciens CC-SAMT-1]
MKNLTPFLLFFTVLTLSVSSCKEDKKVVKQTQVSFKKEGELTIFKADSTTVNLDIEIANSEYETQTGLMYRDAMETNQGMLFIFPDETQRYFYMKNTKIALDIIYISGNKTIVSFQKNAKPFDESALPSTFPAKYVLEVNAGLSDAWSLRIGDRIQFK